MNKENGILEIIFRVQGKGTEILAKKEEENLIDIIGPLGHGDFKYKGYKNIAILGGGIGVFPLYELAKEAKNESINVNTYLGFKNKEAVLLEKEFNEFSDKLVITTDDGSYKIKGFAINELKKDLESNNIDAIFACGPLVMLKAAKNLANEKNIQCQISLEEKMGCGLGVCLGCAVETITGEYQHVCKQGPVFDSSKVII
jgi:dihydroorotate dehydrogenase electron transfer subunit